MGRLIKKTLFPAAVAVLLSLTAIVRQEGFSEGKIRGSLLEGQAAAAPSEVLRTLGQPFRYLAKGRQCFVFVSEDGKTVVKFLNYSRFSLPGWLPAQLLCGKWSNLVQKRERRFDDTVNSFQLAADYLPSETGILYLHLQQGSELPLLSITDPAHRRISVDLNEIAFIVQKRVTPIFDELERRWNERGEKGLEEGIASFFAFLNKRCDLGIADDDRDVAINFGFCQNEPILLDPGRLFFDPALRTKKGREREILVSTKRFRKWLMQSHPECAPFFDAQVSDSLADPGDAKAVALFE